MPAATAAARQAPSSIVIDANSGKILHSQAADAERYPASLTKMMTIYLVFEGLKAGRLKMSTPIRFSQRAANRQPSKLGLKPGQTISIAAAIRALITKSANDVATAVAEHIAGSEEAFARQMTAKARELGMKRTQFRNASGLPDSNQRTTASDMALLGLALQDNFPKGYRMFSQRRFRYRGKNYTNHNKLLGSFRGTDGIKTGYTSASGFNIATSVRRDGKHVVGVVIGQPSGRARNRVMRALLTKSLAKASTRKTRRRPIAPMLVAKPRPLPRPTKQETAQFSRQSRQADGAPAVRSTSRSLELANAIKIKAPPSLSHQGTARRPSTFAQQLRHGQTKRDATVSGVSATRRPAERRATHHVQVGAFFSEEEAKQALFSVQRKAGAILAGARPLFLRVAAPPRTIYRARFAGFDSRRAFETCTLLKKASVDCFVTRSN